MYSLASLIILVTVLAYSCVGYFVGQSFVKFLDHAEHVDKMMTRK